MNICHRLIGAILGLLSFHASAQVTKGADIRLDFGTATSPVEKGWTQITPTGGKTGDNRFRWISRPTEAIDNPQAYPLDALSCDGVRFTTKSPLEFEIDLPKGTYDVSALLGERGDSFRPGMYVEMDGSRIISEVYSYIGTPMWSRARLEHPGGPCRVRLGVERPTFATGSLLALGIQAAKGSEWKPYREDPKDWRPAIRWVSSEKIRMILGISSQHQFDESKGYFVDSTEELWKRGSALGMNCVAASYRSGMAEYFAKAGMRFFHIIPFGNGENFTLREKEFEKNVLFDGRIDNRPNPLDQKAWHELVVKDALAAWRQSKADGTPIAGIVIDLEMYGAKYMEVYHNACTFDEKVFLAFCRDEFRALPSPEKIAPEARYRKLVEAEKLQAYYQYLENRMAAVARQIERDIHQEAPDLLIGYLQHFDNWFFRGLDKGLGTREMPVMAFGENTYFGYNGDAPFEQASLNKLGAHVFYCVGLWPQMLHPDTLWKDAYLAGVESSGFWLFGYGHPMAKEDDIASLDHSLITANRMLFDFLRDGKIAEIGKVDHTLKSPFRPDSEVNAMKFVDADPHPTLLVPLPDWHKAELKFDFGRPDSNTARGWKKVTSLDVFASGKEFGWQRPPRYSFDRSENAAKVLGNSQDLALLASGIATEGENAFLVKVQPGTYHVSVILGDLAPNEYRTHQNVSANGVQLASNVTTNAQEYRIFSAIVPEKNGLIQIDLEGKGAQQQVSLLGLVIEPEAKP